MLESVVCKVFMLIFTTSSSRIYHPSVEEDNTLNASPMRYLVCIIAVLARLNVAQESTCNYVGLVKCFINILDEWAWTLYELKDNVVTITSDQCTHLKELDKCIKYGNEISNERDGLQANQPTTICITNALNNHLRSLTVTAATVN
ncbi:hypothetical protein NECAME_00128 [Necator americanus]|uniref:Uncharacterized protein n=1 Tax=Necator americanus TaxID=51031 RepID=W2U027_NECAM|nr:hypothetical protein NECAME_00128 [Necator americanus]ETN87269.1 hypothetical protein NECAME_00128 [Necator americanus]